MDQPVVQPNRQQYTVTLLLSDLLTGLTTGALLLILLLGITSRVLPQMPPYLQDTPQASTWLLQAQQSFPYLQSFPGLFTITRTPLFRGTLLFLILCTWLHVGYAVYLGFWPRRGTQVPPLSPQAMESSGIWQIPTPFRELQARLRQHLSPRGLVAIDHPAFNETRFFIRYPLSALSATLMLFLSTGLVALGLYLGVTFGWETPPVTLAPGQPWDVGHGTGLRLTLLDRQVVDPPNARAIFVQYLDTPDRNIVRAVQPGQRLSLDGVTLHYLDNALGLALQVIDRAGTPLPLQTPSGRTENTITLLFPASGSEEVVLLPTLGYQLRAVGYTALPERGYTSPVILLQLIDRDGQTVLYNEFLATSRRLTVEGLTVDARLVPHVQVQITAYPGRWLVLTGGLGALLATLLGLRTGPFRRWWVRLQEAPTGTVVQAWSDMYNMGRHRPTSARDVWTWLHHE